MGINIKLFQQCKFAGVIWTIVFVKNGHVHLTSLDGTQHKRYIDISVISVIDDAKINDKEICERILLDGNCDFIEDCEDCPLDQMCAGVWSDMGVILARQWLEARK